jgi:hypothetical protein
MTEAGKIKPASGGQLMPNMECKIVGGGAWAVTNSEGRNAIPIEKVGR